MKDIFRIIISESLSYALCSSSVRKHFYVTSPFHHTGYTQCKEEVFNGNNTNLKNMFSVYVSDHDRYSRVTHDNFDRKLALSLERCDRNLFDEDTSTREFPIMLCAQARQYRTDKLQNRNLNLTNVAEEI